MASLQITSKRPRLSLQIKTTSLPAARSARGVPLDLSDPTAFNTLSNAYVSVVERTNPLHSEPITAINTLQNFSITTPAEYKDSKHRVSTPYVASYPETPITATSTSPPQQLRINFPSAMTATPPLSAGPNESNATHAFPFSAADVSKNSNSQQGRPPTEGRVEQRRISYLAIPFQEPPYPHPQTPLHSILRNSPLPPKRVIIPPSPRRQSLRLLERAARKVGYNSPLTQEITTSKYTKSHRDLLLEEASPRSPAVQLSAVNISVDLVKAFTANEIEDGGQTPGPDATMHQFMSGLGTGTPLAAATPSGIRKRKRREKKRTWLWTIGQEDEQGQEVGGALAVVQSEAVEVEQIALEDCAPTPLTALPQITYSEETLTPSIESVEGDSESLDVEMSDYSSVVSRGSSLAPSGEADGDMKTPTGPRKPDEQQLGQHRDTPIPALENRDTPVPPEQAGVNRDTPVPPEGL